MMHAPCLPLDVSRFHLTTLRYPLGVGRGIPSTGITVMGDDSGGATSSGDGVGVVHGELAVVQGKSSPLSTSSIQRIALAIMLTKVGASLLFAHLL
jgi:hypothetical protein